MGRCDAGIDARAQNPIKANRHSPFWCVRNPGGSARGYAGDAAASGVTIAGTKTINGVKQTADDLQAQARRGHRRTRRRRCRASRQSDADPCPTPTM
ncbi:hypothetical protein Arub01_11230 [Actinomadura rubrobrunea]|uniref:Uncharacterized protein n=1 Tax=Actinomadura rubrobrunea TaxID=115335 RepID=A0A9W6PQR5_9ACTN|nr:hypothetical protein Arub01_11230 [Actinomadura rubrobrunea]